MKRDPLHNPEQDALWPRRGDATQPRGRNKSQQESSQQHLTGREPSAVGHTSASMAPLVLLVVPTTVTAPTATPAGRRRVTAPGNRHHRSGWIPLPPPSLPPSVSVSLIHTHTRIHTPSLYACCSHASEFPELTHTLQQTCTCVLTLTHAVSLTRTGF